MCGWSKKILSIIGFFLNKIFYVDVRFKSKTLPEVDRKGISINTMCVDPAP